MLRTVTIENTGSVAETVLGLPDNGIVPVGTRDFLVDDANLDRVQRELRAKKSTLKLLHIGAADEDTHGNPVVAMGFQVQCRAFVVRYSNLTEADGSQVLADDFVFPERAIGLGTPVLVLEEAFTAPTADGCTLDAGLVAGAGDTFFDGVNVFTGATLGEILPLATQDAEAPRLLENTSLEVTIAMSSDDVTDATAGRAILYQLYIVMPLPRAS